MIQLFLTRDLALHVAEHLPSDDPLRTGIAELIAEQDRMGGVIDEPAELTILRNGQVRMEIYNAAEADRVLTVLSAPRALQTVISETGGRARVAALFQASIDVLAERLGLEPDAAGGPDP